MLSKPKRIITVPTDAELLNKHTYRRIWMAARNLAIGRRRWLDVLSSCFCECGHSYELRYRSGDPFPIPEIDEVFGDDPDVRWLSDYLKADETGKEPKYRSRKIDRVRLIAIFFQVEYADLSRHFWR